MWPVFVLYFNGDGDLDAAFANAQVDLSRVWLNDGSGFFTDTEQHRK